MKNWIIICLILLHIPQISLSQHQPSLIKNSHIYNSSSTEDIAMMLTKCIVKDRNWSLVCNQFYSDYFKSIEGTSKDFSKMDKSRLESIKKEFILTFPEFYKTMFKKSILRTNSDKEILFLLYAQCNGWYLSESDRTYFRKKVNNEVFNDNLADNFRTIYRSEIPLWVDSLIRKTR
jgi:hypothetical protein